MASSSAIFYPKSCYVRKTVLSGQKKFQGPRSESRNFLLKGLRQDREEATEGLCLEALLSPSDH